MTPRTVRFFFSFRSPYSYLVGPRAFTLPENYTITFEWRGVRPMVTRGVPLSQAKTMYIMRDCYRVAKKLGMPFGNFKDPLGEGAVRCLHVAELATARGKLKEFVLTSSRGIWAEGKDVANDDVLRGMCESAGLVWAECQQAIANSAYTQRIEDNIALLDQLGHWGVPTFEVDGEVFWGQDRFEYLCRHLDALGLKKSV